MVRLQKNSSLSDRPRLAVVLSCEGNLVIPCYGNFVSCLGMLDSMCSPCPRRGSIPPPKVT